MCGVIGLFASGRDTFDEVVAGLFQMQHRGQDACGIAMADGDRFSLHKATGLVKENRPQEELKAVFDALSFTKARVLLIYWDWFMRRAGPYAKPPEPGLVEDPPLA